MIKAKTVEQFYVLKYIEEIPGLIENIKKMKLIDRYTVKVESIDDVLYFYYDTKTKSIKNKNYYEVLKQPEAEDISGMLRCTTILKLNGILEEIKMLIKYLEEDGD